jgi:hypothetical protein
MLTYSICLHCGNLIGRKDRRYCPHCDTPQKRAVQREAQAALVADRSTGTRTAREARKATFPVRA